MKTRKVWVHLSDLTIERTEQLGKPVTRVYDADGDVIVDIAGHFPDSVIGMVMKVANQAYDAGFRCGEYSRSSEIFALLQPNRSA
ncbi:hypothetical protein UXN85_20660 [Enterobacter hormaechei]